MKIHDCIKNEVLAWAPALYNNCKGQALIPPLWTVSIQHPLTLVCLAPWFGASPENGYSYVKNKNATTCWHWKTSGIHSRWKMFFIQFSRAMSGLFFSQFTCASTQTFYLLCSSSFTLNELRSSAKCTTDNMFSGVYFSKQILSKTKLFGERQCFNGCHVLRSHVGAVKRIQSCLSVYVTI